MSRTAVPTIVGIIEEVGGTVEDYPETVVEALDKLAEVIESGSGASIDLGITGATVGEVAAVKTVDASGKPTAWETKAVEYTLTITCVTQDGVTVTGQTVTIRQGGADGPVYDTLAYSGQPVSLPLPKSFTYFVSVTDTLASHFNPTTASGVIVDADVSVMLTYSDFSSITTAADIKAALDLDVDLSLLVGEQITCTRGNQTLTWDVVDYDSSGVVTLLLSDCSAFSSNVQFEPTQALKWCESGLAIGDYSFKAGNSTYYFTTTKAVPAGGQLRATSSAFQTYESQDATAYIESGTVSTTATANPTDLGTAGTGLLNNMDRVNYGSNNFAESVMVNYLLNSDTAAGTVVHGRTKFCRAWTMPFDGFLAGMDASFLAAISTEDWKCSAQTAYECPAELGGLTAKGQPYTFSAKFALASEKEIFGSYGGVDDGTSIMDLFVGATNDDRKRYRGSSAQNWWLRSPSPGDADSVRHVITSGTAGHGHAIGSFAAVPACKIRKSE